MTASEGITYLDKKEYQKAYEQFDHAAGKFTLIFTKQKKDVLFYEGEALYQMGEYGKAIEIYDQLIDHGESRAYSLKAYCLAQQKKLNKSDVNFKVTGISRVIKHELNEELFEMAYKGKGIKTEEDFRKAAKEDLCKTYSNQADRYFMDSASKALIENTKMDLPDEFLKRWLVEINQGKVDSKEILDNYDKYRDSIKWYTIS